MCKQTVAESIRCGIYSRNNERPNGATLVFFFFFVPAEIWSELPIFQRFLHQSGFSFWITFAPNVCHSAQSEVQKYHHPARFGPRFGNVVEFSAFRIFMGIINRGHEFLSLLPRRGQQSFASHNVIPAKASQVLSHLSWLCVMLIRFIRTSINAMPSSLVNRSLTLSIYISESRMFSCTLRSFSLCSVEKFNDERNFTFFVVTCFPIILTEETF